MEPRMARCVAGRWTLVAVALSGALTLGACAGRQHQAGFRAGSLAERSSDARLTVAELVDAGSQGVTDLSQLGEDVQRYQSDVTTLSNPFFEGRAPGTRGIEMAAQYIEQRFQSLGLEPLPGSSGEPTYRHWFTVSGEIQVEKADVELTLDRSARRLRPGEDYNAMGVSGTATAEGPIVFVGYSIEDGPRDYKSIPADVDLSGKIAMVMRFEPMTAPGKSTWSEDARWSIHANLAPKIEYAFKRGAAGVIFVNAPGADDARAERMMTTSESAFGAAQPGPVIMLSNEMAEEVVRSGDPEGRSLMDLRRIVDHEGRVIDLSRARMRMDLAVERERIETCNVGAVLPGRGALADEYVVIGAHYDHLGYGAYGSNDPDSRGKIHPGADDNASGTAGVLLAAQELSRRYAELPMGTDARSVLFLCFSAEEMGLIGSREFVQDRVVAPTAMNLMINMDMIGRVKDREVQVGGLGTAEEIASMVDPILDESGLKISRVRGGWGPSDHSSFSAASVPVVTFFSGLHRQYHTPQDEAWRVNNAGGAAVALLAADVAYAFALRQGALAFIETRPEGGPGARRSDAKVRLGIMPDMSAYAGEETPGVLLGGVTPGGSAAEGGLLKGDRIIRWDGEELADIRAMMQRLSSHNPGDKVRITVVRDGEEVDLDVTLQARGGGGLREVEDTTLDAHDHDHGPSVSLN